MTTPHVSVERLGKMTPATWKMSSCKMHMQHVYRKMSLQTLPRPQAPPRTVIAAASRAVWLLPCWCYWRGVFVLSSGSRTCMPSWRGRRSEQQEGQPPAAAPRGGGAGATAVETAGADRGGGGVRSG
jgi:hypothetical protein